LTYIPSLEARVEEIYKKLDNLEFNIFAYCTNQNRVVKENNLTRGEWAKEHNKDRYFNFGVKYIFENAVPYIYNLSAKKLAQLLSACD